MELLALLVAAIVVIAVVSTNRSRKTRQQIHDHVEHILKLERDVYELQVGQERLEMQVARMGEQLHLGPMPVVAPEAPPVNAEAPAEEAVEEVAAPATPVEVPEPATARVLAGLGSAPENVAAPILLPEAEAAAPQEAEVAAKETAKATPSRVPYFRTLREEPPRPRPPTPIESAGVHLRNVLGIKAGTPVNWEALVGGRWLNLIGMLVLVVGIALLSQQALLYLGPMGKILFGAGLGLAILIGGLLLERRDAYRWIGRTLIGGGWAILYFDVYAAYNVAQAKVIYSPAFALVLLVVVAAGMIIHSLRYRAELVTGLAFGLAFLAIVLTPVTIASVVAAALLAAGLVFLSWRFSWHHLAVAGALGTYANHWLWLTRLISEPAAAVTSGWLDAPLPGQAVFWLSCGLLAFYWLLFALVSLRPRNKLDDLATAEHTTLAVINTLGMALLLQSQFDYAFRGHYLWAISAPLAVACISLAFLDRRMGQRLLFLVNAAMGLIAFSVTLPLAIQEYSWQAGWMGPYFAAGGLLTIAVGARTRELLVRVMGYALSTVGFLAVMTIQFRELDAAQINLLWFATVGVIVAYQVAAEMTRRKDLDQGGPGVLFGLAATFMFAGLLWLHVPHEFIAPVWMAIGLGLFELGKWLRKGHEVQGYALMLMAPPATLAFNIYLIPVDAVPIATWLSPMLVAAGLYYYFARARHETPISTLPIQPAGIGSAVASLLFGLVAWNELPSLAVAPVWSLLGLLLFEAGGRFKEPVLKAQAHVAMAAVFVRLFMANLVVDGDLGGISFRLITVVPVVLILIYLRYRVPADQSTSNDKSIAGLAAPVLAGLYSWASAILVVMLFRFEFGRAHTVAAWAPLLLAMLYFGRRTADRHLRFQSYVLAVYGFLRGWSTNIYLDGIWLGVDERLSTTLPMIVALFIASLICRHGLPQPATTDTPSGRLVRALGLAERHAVAFFATLGAGFLAVLLYNELPSDYVSIGFALEGVALLVAGFALQVRSYRLLGLAALFVALIKVVFIDLAGVQEPYRTISFIVLGVILLGASLVYTRYRGLIEKYL